MGSSWDIKGEAGIGSSVIFIAMILTSSTAGSLLIGNMEAAGSQADAALDGSLQLTTNHVNVRSVVGACDQAAGRVVSLELLVSLGAGSDSLNLSALVIELITIEACDYLTLDTGFTARKILDGGVSNGTVLADGDLYLLSLAIPGGAGVNDMVEVILLPASGFATTFQFRVPDHLTSDFISII